MANEGLPRLSVEEYIAGLPEHRARDIETVRRRILDCLPDGYHEETGFGMIVYVIPLARYPVTYNKQPLMYAALGSHKSYMSVYLMNVYGDPETEQWFTGRYRATGKKLNMGKSCVRFKSVDDLPLELIGDAIGRTTPEEYIQHYEAARARPKQRRAT